MAKISYLECTKCGEKVSGDQPQTICPKDGGSLYVRYDLDAIKKKFTRESLAGRPASMWRYAGVLPDADPVTLGEGFTPMLPSRKTPNVFIKDEGLNPTGSFKARGLCAAVTMARHYGLRKLAIPSAGNAASALAAYCAAAAIEAHIFMPKDVPQANLVECQSYGAHVTLVDGLISDCARMLGEQKEKQGWFDISTLKEPFRVEGKKTMGYEVAEQLGWQLPDAIFYPTGGGVGLIGMWKAFEEMEQLGWIGKKRPKMVAVQSAGCAPIPKAWDEGKTVSEMWKDASTVAAGLRVPKAYGDYIILDILKKSGGTAIAVSDAEIMECVRRWASEEGVFAAPEGAASLAAYEKLIASKFLKPGDTCVLFNTGSGLKYIDVIAAASSAKKEKEKEAAVPAGRNIGGIIGPY
ncbi:MAG: threonine synthase [Candidatus Koribacter versatilis]|uniref:Threonine synthase n=1 Tax=Candidatus Korobacter versatilis TaxID=658062 RepID=A0A932EPY9_9BACT|nr:threonine synthase [Candidatus Koribacter versatilis]